MCRENSENHILDSAGRWVCREQKVEEIQARPGSPDWLQHELAQTRTGLAALHQNVILLPKDKDRSAFYPVCPAPLLPLIPSGLAFPCVDHGCTIQGLR